MPKKVRFESFKYRLLIAAQKESGLSAGPGYPTWQAFVRALRFEYEGREIRILWKSPSPGALIFPLHEPVLYQRGDTEQHRILQGETGLTSPRDPVKLSNELYFKRAIEMVAHKAGYRSTVTSPDESQIRLETERKFHDAWADSEDVQSIDVCAVNEVCTAPEMRFIKRRIGDVKGKRLLDIGCGLGEASVYFARLGALVTASDLSPGMLDATVRLAQVNRVTVIPHLASAEDMKLTPEQQFDIIYAGNLLHHVDIDETLSRVMPHLAPDGICVTWDPLAYNPVINVYRAMATEVRTPDEHPFRRRDLAAFRKHFSTVETKYFWLTTLAIFLVMALIQRRNPNKERFWKVVVKEGKKWAWLYYPLELVDRLLLALIPPLRLLCWNVVVICKR